LREFIATLEQRLAGAGEQLATRLDDAAERLDSNASGAVDASKQRCAALLDNVGDKANAALHTSKQRCAELKAVLGALVPREAVADVYAALLASPAQVQTLVLSLVDRAKQSDLLQASSSRTRHAALCDECHAAIVGARYKCANCADFDLCEQCEARNADGRLHDRTHVFLKLTMPLPARSAFQLPNLYAAARKPCPVATTNNNTAAASSSSSSKQSPPLLAARFVRDVSVGDNSQMTPNVAFVKIWCIRNAGAAAWPAGCRVVFVGGDALSDYDASEPLPAVPADAEVNVAIDMRTPTRAGRYTSFWRLATPDGRRFGHRLWCSVHCEDVVAPQPAAAAADDAVAQNNDDVGGEQEAEAEAMLADIERSFAKVGQSVAVVEDAPEQEEEQEQVVEEPVVENNDDDDEEEVEASEEAPEDQAKAAPLLFASQARQLQNMGFADHERNAALLEAHSGDVLAAVQDLLADH
jgi:hypothetical protein